MVRRVAHAAYREDQWRHRYDPHVEPINRFIDELGSINAVGHPPYVAPMYRGVNARALAVLRDPGPKAGGAGGSGFLSVENNDATAERQCEFMEAAGIDPAEVVPWNAYPWYINAKPSTSELRAGTEPLRRLIDLLPDLRVVLLLGADAQRAWRYFVGQHAGVVTSRGIQALETYHPGRQAMWHPDPDVRRARQRAIEATMAEAVEILGNRTPV